MITLAYPSGTPTITLTLPNPVLQNNEEIDVKPIFKRTMSGRFRTHKRTPTTTKLTLSFDILKDADVTNFKTFLDASNREEIKLTLWNDDVWIGKILTVPIPFQHDGYEKHSVTIQFQGVKQ